MYSDYFNKYSKSHFDNKFLLTILKYKSGSDNPFIKEHINFNSVSELYSFIKSNNYDAFNIRMSGPFFELHIYNE